MKNNKASGVNSEVNKFFNYCGCEFRYRLLKVMNMIFEKGEVSCGFGKNTMKLLYKKSNKSEWDN